MSIYVGTISSFFRGETKEFNILLKRGGVAQDITGDTVTFRMKSNKSDTDASAALTKQADVASQGASGWALFALTTTDTEVIEDTYQCDIEWVLSGGEEFIVYDGTIEVKVRVSDS